jgi:cytosine/adenosine deaminase-related metal-dependent hydrolase
LNRIFSAESLVPGDAPPIAGGALLSLDGRIAAIGPLAQLRRAYPEVEIVDFGAALLVPLLVNAHTHLELTDYPEWALQAGETAAPKDFVDWILRLIRVKRSQGKKPFRESVANGLTRSLHAGTGAIGDILSHYPSRTAYADSPLQGILFLESLGQDPAVIQRIRKGLEDVLLEERVGAVELGISPHTPYSISATYLAALYKKCRNERLRCTTHLAESQAEVEFIEKSSGDLVTGLYPSIGWESLVPWPADCSPTEYLRRRGGLFPRNLLVHGVHLTGADIKLLAEAGMFLALCPRSNARLNVGQAPVASLHKAGVKLALGTDSLASNDSLSLWDELAFAHGWFAGQLDPPTLFQMATLGGAAALGLETELGSLTVGKQCSFQLLRPASKVNLGEVNDYFMAPGRTGEIEQVYIRGQARLQAPADRSRAGG